MNFKHLYEEYYKSEVEKIPQDATTAFDDNEENSEDLHTLILQAETDTSVLAEKQSASQNIETSC
jgi:hypothetical protein